MAAAAAAALALAEDKPDPEAEGGADEALLWWGGRPLLMEGAGGPVRVVAMAMLGLVE